MKKIFGEDVFAGFTSAYRNILEAIEDNDVTYLKMNMEANLTKDLKIPNLQRINPKSPISYRVVDLGFMFGKQFDRAASPGQDIKDNYHVDDLVRFQFAPISSLSPTKHTPILWTSI